MNEQLLIKCISILFQFIILMVEIDGRPSLPSAKPKTSQKNTIFGEIIASLATTNQSLALVEQRPELIGASAIKNDRRPQWDRGATATVAASAKRNPNISGDDTIRTAEQIVTKKSPSLRTVVDHTNVIDDIDGANQAIRKPRRANIVFPDSSQENRLDSDYDYGSISYTPFETIPTCAKAGLTFCEDVAGYPAEYVESLLELDTDTYKELQKEDDVVTSFDMTHRFDTSNGDIPYCSSDSVVIYPKVALSVNNHWSYIINQRQFVQGVRVELCSRSDGDCLFASRLPNLYESQCRQKFMERMLLSLDAEGATVRGMFLLPSHCECVLRKVGRI